MSKRYVKTRVKERFGPKIEKVNISEKYFWPRAIAAGVLLLIGTILLAHSCARYFGTQDGWQEITIESSQETNYSSEFSLQYDIGRSGVSAGVEKRNVTATYTEALTEAYDIFNADEQGKDSANLYDLNQHPNETLTVSKELYQALETLEQYDARWIYLGPVYALSTNLFQSEDDVIASDYDPYREQSLADFYQKIADFARDPQQIQIEKKGNNQVCLKVSQEYMQFAKNNEIDQFVELSYMRNAFVCDYIADKLTEEGYTNGFVSSYEGYTRYLNREDYSYTGTIYGRNGAKTGKIADETISGMNATVVLKDFAVADLEKYRYYKYGDGTARSSYMSLSDGKDYAAIPYLYAASENSGCAEILLQLLPHYITDEWDVDAVYALSKNGIYVIYTENGKAYTNLPNNEYKESP